MKLKNILMNCLRLGKVVAIVTFFALQASCEGNVDCVANAEWIYCNQSSSKITILLGRGNFSWEHTKIEIESGRNYSFFEEGSSPFKDFDAWDYVPLYSLHGATIIVGEQSYWVNPDEGIADIKNYEAQRLNRTLFRFTYTFTDEILEQLKLQSE